jgi:hypothetical protein
MLMKKDTVIILSVLASLLGGMFLIGKWQEVHDPNNKVNYTAEELAVLREHRQVPTLKYQLSILPKENWQNTQSGRYAHSLKYEDKLAKPVPYIFGKKPIVQDRIDYFEHLCATEGHDYIWKTATNVDSIAQLRSFEYPKVVEEDNFLYNGSLYGQRPELLEGPLFFNFGIADEIVREITDIEHTKNIIKLDMRANEPLGKYGLVFPEIVGTGKYATQVLLDFYSGFYNNYEMVFNNGSIISYATEEKLNYHNTPKRVIIVENKLSSKYGWTWKGISREKDREHGISGGDLIIVDLENNEVMAVQRNFAFGNIACFESYKNVRDENLKLVTFKNKVFEEKFKLVKSSMKTNDVYSAFIEQVLKNELVNEKIERTKKLDQEVAEGKHVKIPRKGFGS